MSSNYFAGYLPSYFSSGNLLAVDFSNNYFSGSTLVISGRSVIGIAPSKSLSGLFIGRNCLDYTDCTGCANSQRSLSECLNFCDAKQELGSCGDNGWCWWDDTGKGTCYCDSGYVLSATNTTCISRETIVKNF